MLDKNQWLAIGLLSGFAYILGKDRESFEAESLDADAYNKDGSFKFPKPYVDCEGCGLPEDGNCDCYLDEEMIKDAKKGICPSCEYDNFNINRPCEECQVVINHDGPKYRMNAESFEAEEWWEEYRDELEAVDKSSLDDFELMIWNDDIVKKHGKAKMMQLIINTVEYSTKLSPQLARIAFKQEKDGGEWEEGMTFEEMYNPNFENYSAESFKAENLMKGQMENIYLVALGMAHQEILNGGERATMEIWFEGRPVMLAIDNAADYFAINPKVLQSRYDSHNFVEPDWRDEYHQALSALKESFPTWDMFTPKGKKRFDL